MAIKGFQRNFGRVSTYSCRICAHLTRDTDGEASVELCFPCYELAGLENSLSDDGLEEFKRAGYPAAVAQNLAAIEKRGNGDAGWRKTFAAVLA